MTKLLFAPPALGTVLSLTGLPGGGNKIHDRSPYSNIGTITGATWKVLPSGLWYLSFDGSDDYVECGSDTSLLNALGGSFTMGLWLRRQGDMGGRYEFVIGIREAAGRPASWMRIEDTKKTSCQTLGPVTGYADVYSDSALDNGWHQVYGVRDVPASTLKLYVDGEVQADVHNDTLGTLTLTTDLRIAYNFSWDWLTGYIALPYVCNRALSALEIQNHFNREKHLFGV